MGFILLSFGILVQFVIDMDVSLKQNRKRIISEDPDLSLLLARRETCLRALGRVK